MIEMFKKKRTGRPTNVKHPVVGDLESDFEVAWRFEVFVKGAEVNVGGSF